MSEEKGIEAIVKEALKETIEELMPGRDAISQNTTGLNHHQSFNITKIDNGFLLEVYGQQHKRLFAETKEKAFELALES